MKKKLAEQATRLLRRAGYRADGRPRGAVRGGQIVFEKKAIRVPMGGKPGR